MSSAPETDVWTMLTGVDAALDHLRSAAVESGFRSSSGDEGVINIEIPFPSASYADPCGLPPPYRRPRTGQT